MVCLVEMTRELIVDFYPVLKAVSRVKDKQMRKRLLQQLSRDRDFRLCIQELAKNVAKEVVPLSVRDKRRLNREAPVVRDLIRARKISQSGGFLNIVVPLLATVVAELIASRK